MTPERGQGMKRQNTWLPTSSSAKSPPHGIMVSPIANSQTRHTHVQKRMQARLPNTDIDSLLHKLQLGVVAPAFLLLLEAAPPRLRGCGHRKRRGRVTAGQAVQLTVKSCGTVQFKHPFTLSPAVPLHR